MHQRCTDPDSVSYKWYGARGISVCPEWSDFERFIADMGPSPPGYSIDRINNDGNYEPGNCRWATPHEQAGNRSYKSKWGVGVYKLVDGRWRASISINGQARGLGTFPTHEEARAARATAVVNAPPPKDKWGEGHKTLAQRNREIQKAWEAEEHAAELRLRETINRAHEAARLSGKSLISWLKTRELNRLTGEVATAP
jgi:hypothetical protein